MAGRIKDKEAWREFLIISFLLLVALGMALLSSVVLSQSHIVLSKMLAGASLLIAVVVSIIFVPRLVRRVQWQGGPWPSLGITKEGGAYLATILIIAMAALNTGNNLLFLILAMLLSAIVASGVISRVSLKGISVSLQIPDHPSAGDPVTFKVTLKNHKRLFPSISLAVEGYQQRAGWLSRGSAYLATRLKRRASPGEEPTGVPAHAPLLEHPVYFPIVPAQKQVVQTMIHVFPRRGRYTLNGFRISTRFPFGFFRKTQRIEAAGEVLVYPQVMEIGPDLQRPSSWNGQQPTLRRGHGEELYSYRKYQTGDDARFVDWKATAKMSYLVLKDFSKEDEQQVCLILDTRRYVETAEFNDAFERAVSLAAGVAAHFIQEGVEVELALPHQRVPPGVGRRHLYRILRMLADVQPIPVDHSFTGPPGTSAPAVAPAYELVTGRGFKIVLTSQPRAALDAAPGEGTRIIFFDEIEPQA